jgi:hypothetical protein
LTQIERGAHFLKMEEPVLVAERGFAKLIELPDRITDLGALRDRTR